MRMSLRPRRLLLWGSVITLALTPVSTGTAAPLPKPQCTLPTEPNQATLGRADKRAVRELLATAKVAYDKGDFLAATTAIRSAYQLSPSVEILYNLAQACKEAGNWQEALLLFERLRERNPAAETKEEAERQIEGLRKHVSESHDERARGLLDLGQADRASEAWTEAYQIYPSPVYLYRRGKAQRAAADLSGAIASYTEFLRVAAEDPLAAEVKVLLTRLQSTDEQIRSGKKDYEQGAYPTALASFQAAHRLEQLPILLFYSAQARQKLEATAGNRKVPGSADNETAVLLYERFLRESPPSQHLTERQQAEAEIAKDRLLTKQALHQPVYKRWWFWTAVLGGAAAVTAVSVGLGISYRNAHQDPLPDVPPMYVIPIP